MRTLAIAAALLMLGGAANAGQGDTWSPNMSNTATVTWNGKYGTRGFAIHGYDPAQGDNRSRDRTAQQRNGKQIDATHKAKRGPQYPGGYADNGLHGKGRQSHETGFNQHGNR